jgi:hypothetical protein
VGSAAEAQHKARLLRIRAADELDEGSFAECIDSLDEARAKDPAGDAAPEVVRLRARAEKALAGRAKK